MSLTVKHPALALVATAALVIGFAAPASAAVTVAGDNVTSDAVADIVRPLCSAGNLGATGTATTGSPCATLEGLDVYAGDGADTVDLSLVTLAQFPALKNVEVYLGDDADVDQATGSVFGDTFAGDRDDSASGGAGDDTFDGVGTAIGGPGDDVFLEAYDYASGGGGDDRFVQFTASSGIEGGEGVDTWEADVDQTVVNVLPPAPTFFMDATRWAYSVGAAEVSVPVSGVERVEFTMLRLSDDTWQGATLPATQAIRALSGNDRLNGGALDDHLQGGLGDDVLTGNAGRDALDGGAGNDTVNARDGEVDTITCGDGTDTVVADAGDVVSGCEVVQLPAVVTPPPAPVVPATSAIKGRKTYAKPVVARFGFSSLTPGATFQCKLDKGRWKTCTSRHRVKTARLKVGKHKLQVRAVLAGVVDPTPSVKKFTVTP